MTRTVLIIFIVFFANKICAQSKEDELFLSFLIQYKFDQANSLLIHSSHTKERAAKLALSSIIYHKGQDSITDTKLVEQIIRLPNSYYQEAWLNLVLSYYDLYYSRGSKTVIESTNRAYLSAKNQGYKSLEKLSLLAFLQIYAQENTLSKRDFDYYHDEYAKIAQNIEDFAWLYYYTNFFDGMSASFPERFVKSSEELYNFTSNNDDIIPSNIKAYLYQNIALNFRSKNQLDSASTYLQEIIKLKDQPYLKKIKFNSYLELGRINVKYGNTQTANHFFNQAKNYFDYQNNLNSATLFKRYKAINYYEPLEIWDSAYYYMKESRLDEAKLNYKNNNKLISELNVQLRTTEKEKIILKQEKEALTQKAKTKQITIALTSTLLLGSIIAFLVYRNTKRKQRIAEQDHELQIQKTETILKEKELETINAMVSGQEKERVRLAGELHDNIGSTLATVRMQVENLERNLDKVDNPKALLQKANLLINETYEKVRGISHKSNSGVMAKEGLLPAIQKLARTVSTTNKLAIDVQDFGLENRIPNELEITIFRIIQELVTNIVKHAQATEATISLTQHDNELNIIVEDNGKGFKVGKLEEKDGMGLGNIERRVEHLEGTMEVDSAQGRGTSVSIDIPYNDIMI